MPGSIERGVNTLENSIDIQTDVVIPEAQHTIAFLLQPARPRLITRLSVLRSMLRSIDFNNKACRHTGKIRNIGTDRNLPAKMTALHRQPSKMAPQSFLRASCVGA